MIRTNCYSEISSLGSEIVFPWVFDDTRTSLKQEPFVLGASSGKSKRGISIA